MSSAYPDFTGHWKQVRNENADGYLKAIGTAFPLRKIAVPIMGRSTDIVKQAGDVQVVTTINAKGTWTRKYVIGQEVEQKNAEGDDTVAIAWWDKDGDKVIHKSKMTGGKRGVSESWRWFEGTVMVIKSIVHRSNKVEAWMLWYFESIEPVRNENFISAQEKLKKITREQKLISELTEEPTKELTDQLKELSDIQQVFVTSMVKTLNKSREKQKGFAMFWKKKAIEEEDENTKSADESDNCIFYDCDENLSKEQMETLEQKAKDIDKKFTFTQEHKKIEEILSIEGDKVDSKNNAASGGKSTKRNDASEGFGCFGCFG